MALEHSGAIPFPLILLLHQIQFSRVMDVDDPLDEKHFMWNWLGFSNDGKP